MSGIPKGTPKTVNVNAEGSEWIPAVVEGLTVRGQRTDNARIDSLRGQQNTVLAHDEQYVHVQQLAFYPEGYSMLFIVTT